MPGAEVDAGGWISASARVDLCSRGQPDLAARMGRQGAARRISWPADSTPRRAEAVSRSGWERAARIRGGSNGERVLALNIARRHAANCGSEHDSVIRAAAGTG